MNDNQTRKLAAILFADIVGYTALMQKDDATANILLDKFHQTLNNKVAAHTGQVINNYGDGCVCTFDSTINAMRCAKEVQSIYQQEPKVPVRIGLHSGDVLFKENNVYGDSVNIASRIESLGKAGAVLFSERIKNNIANQSEFQAQSVGSFEFKNVKKPMEVFALANEGMVVPKKEEMKGKLKSSGNGQSKWLIRLSGLLVVGIFAAGYYFFTNNNTQTLSENNQELISSIAVFPFEVNGSSDVQYLGEGMVDLISTRLDEIPNINSIDPNLVFSKLDKESTISRLPQKATALAVSFGASHFILGRIVAIDDNLEITATRYNAQGERMDHKSVRGTPSKPIADTVDDLIKLLVAKELEDSGQELESLAAMMSSNLESLKAYLKGEQAFRNGGYGEAYQFFTEATELDSTFALAWMRVGDAAVWNLEVDGGPARRKWAEYRHTMPKKWQEYYDALQLYNSADLRAIAAYKKLIRRYGEHYAFLNGLGEFYFHFNPVYGQSQLEAKSYLEKAIELDPQNKEALIHLGQIAALENDSVGFQQIMSNVDKGSEVYPYLRGSEFLFQDTVTDEEIKDFINHPQFLKEHLTSGFLEPQNQLINFDLMDRIFTFYPDKEFELDFEVFRLGYGGKEIASYASAQKLAKVKSSFNWPYDQYQRVIPASLMVTKEFLPRSEHYETLYQETKNRDVPWDIYAAIKYAIALNKKKEVVALKEKLLSLAKTPRTTKMVNYYDYSIKAFEAYMGDDPDKTLVYIDSAFQYSFGYWEIQISHIDKTIMAANIYAETGDYEKAIPYMENLVPVFGGQMVKGYTWYKLIQWYEAIGDTQNALTKCNLLLKNYKDCDEKYKPWVEEVKERRQRLMSKLN